MDFYAAEPPDIGHPENEGNPTAFDVVLFIAVYGSRLLPFAPVVQLVLVVIALSWAAVRWTQTRG